MTKQEKAIREFCGHHADWWPSTTQVQEMLALAQPEQEPVAYLSNKRQRLNIELKPQTFVEIPTATDWEMPLYMKPPQRKWVGLTDEEIKAFDTWHDNREEEVGWCNPSEIVAYIEAKLKDKNTRGQK